MTQPPQDLDAERLLLGTLIQFPSAIPDVSARMKPDDLYRPGHQYIYNSALSLFNEGHPVSATSVLSDLDRREWLNQSGGASYLTDLIQLPTTAEGVEYYVGLILEKSRLRRIKELSVRLDQCTELDADTVMEAVYKFVDESHVESEPQADSFDDAYRSWVDWYDDDTVAIPTPWPGVNSMLMGGLYRGRLYLVAGRPGAGKSAFCLNAVLRAANAGYRSVVYSLEMGREECMARILSSATGVPLKNLFMHRLSVQDRDRIENFATNQTRPYMQINDKPSQTIESIMADCRARKKRGLDLVAIDHSLLLDPSDRRTPLHQQVTHVAKQSKLLARRLDCAVLLLHQMNRAKDREDRKPRFSDLREGGEMDADAVIVLDRDSDNNQIATHLLKNRMGPADRVAYLADELAYGRLG